MWTYDGIDPTNLFRLPPTQRFSQCLLLTAEPSEQLLRSVRPDAMPIAEKLHVGLEVVLFAVIDEGPWMPWSFGVWSLESSVNCQVSSK